MKVEQFFAQHSVFTSSEFFAYLGKSVDYKHTSAKALLVYHEKTGHILRVRRGLYATIPIAQRQGDFQVNPYLIAGRIVEDSILGYHTALDLHGFAYSVFNHFYYLTHKKIRTFEFQGNIFRAIPFPKQLLVSDQENFAITTVNREGLDIKVTSLERTLVDSLHRPEFVGGWEEIWLSFNMVTILQLDKVIEYALLLDNATTIAKVGFFLEQHSEQFKVTEDYLHRLEIKIPKHKHYLERGKRFSGKLIKRWNLIVPEKVLLQQWEEPNEVF